MQAQSGKMAFSLSVMMFFCRCSPDLKRSKQTHLIWGRAIVFAGCDNYFFRFRENLFRDRLSLLLLVEMLLVSFFGSIALHAHHIQNDRVMHHAINGSHYVG